MKTALFVKGPSLTFRFAVLVLASLIIMIVDHRSQSLEGFHHYLGAALHPLQQAIDFPSLKFQQISTKVTDELTLNQQNKALREENKRLSVRLQEFLVIREENDQLRLLLDSSLRPENEVTSARLLAVSLNPFQQRVLIDKGKSDGVSMGITIVDQHGLMGQVTRVFPFHSEGMLASDPNHAIPVQSIRTGVRGILKGTGSPDMLILSNAPFTSDIIPGDILVTSGIGGRFPPDYPVATVKSVSPQTGKPFAKIEAIPLASFNKSRNVLLIHAVPRKNNAPSSEEAPADGK